MVAPFCEHYMTQLFIYERMNNKSTGYLCALYYFLNLSLVTNISTTRNVNLMIIKLYQCSPHNSFRRCAGGIRYCINMEHSYLVGELNSSLMKYEIYAFRRPPFNSLCNASSRSHLPAAANFACLGQESGLAVYMPSDFRTLRISSDDMDASLE